MTREQAGRRWMTSVSGVLWVVTFAWIIGVQGLPGDFRARA